jgi:hypothetical protein
MNKTANIKEHIDVITQCVCKSYSISVNELKAHAKCRKQEYNEPRKMIWTISKELLEWRAPYEVIGKLVGNKHHATVLIAVHQVRNRMDVDKTFEREYKALSKNCRIAVEVMEKHKKTDARPMKDRLFELLKYKKMHNLKIGLREIISNI